MAQMLDDVSDEDRIKVHQLVQKQLGDVWNSVSESNLIIKRFAIGYVNNLFYCELPDNVKQKSCDGYDSVVVKSSKKIDNSQFSNPITVTVNSLLLSEKKIGPKVLKIFSGGIISEFIDGRQFTSDDDDDLVTASLLARKLAQFHSLRMPIIKDNTEKFTSGFWDDWFDENVKKPITEGVLCQAFQSETRKKLLDADLGAEFRWIRRQIIAFNSPIVFAHCDLNRGNILVREKNHNLDIFLIDFDSSSYFYRGFDFGKYFSSWGQNNWVFSIEGFPTDSQMCVFIDAYIENSIELFGNSFSKLKANSKENLIKEAKIFTLFTYLSFVASFLWNAVNDQNKIDYNLERAEARFTGYNVLKNIFLEEKVLPVHIN